MTSRWSAPVRPAWRRRSMRPRKAFPSSCSMRASFGGQAGRQRADRELFRLPDRHFRPGADGPRLHPGAEIRRRNDDPGAGEGARLRARRRRAWRSRSKGDGRIQARSVVVASGARYRRPAIADLARFEGRGVWYWASPIEARLCAGEEIILVGGGNSAGQAAVFLSGHAARVRMMVRAGGLAESMSRYLIDRIEAAPNIELMTRTEIVALAGRAHAQVWSACAGAITRAAPRRKRRSATSFSSSAPIRRRAGSRVAASRSTRPGFVDHRRRRGPRSPLETSIPGVFAVGDVRSGSVKRVGGAIGEGAQVVQAHPRLSRRFAKPRSLAIEGAAMAKTCTHLHGIRDVTPSALGLRGMPAHGRAWFHLRVCRTCGHVGCCDQSPGQHATKHFHATQHPIIEGYDPPEGWGWCYVDELMFDLSDRMTPHNGPIPPLLLRTAPSDHPQQRLARSVGELLGAREIGLVLQPRDFARQR